MSELCLKSDEWPKTAAKISPFANVEPMDVKAGSSDGQLEGDSGAEQRECISGEVVKRCDSLLPENFDASRNIISTSSDCVCLGEYKMCIENITKSRNCRAEDEEVKRAMKRFLHNRIKVKKNVCGEMFDGSELDAVKIDIKSAMEFELDSGPISVYPKLNDQICVSKLNNCTEMVKPYLHDLRYMFPTNIDDVEEMCRMWSQFVDCVRRYVSSCFTEERRSKFNEAVEKSVDTVHAICSSDVMQREYLSSAECFKRVSVENCGSFYKQLIEFVSNPKAHDDHICCSYTKFKICVSEPLLRDCGHNSRSMMDYSMSFLINRCGQKFENRNEKCPPPPPVETTTVSASTAGDFLSNDIQHRARADRSFGPSLTTNLPN
ncbi:hypothetical protein B4U79_14017, partial [Dinothrombium tinctorium]